jgi:hypothetical protein
MLAWTVSIPLYQLSPRYALCGSTPWHASDRGVSTDLHRACSDMADRVRETAFACRTARLHCRWLACGPRCAVLVFCASWGREAEPRFDMRVGSRGTG